MSYTVLARKYRPQKFSDVIGQDHVTRTLKNAIEQQRIAHGYIFSGHRGIGKTTIARILAMALNCRSAGPPGRRALRRLRFLPRDSRRQRGRRDRNRRRHQSRHRRNSRAARSRPLPPGPRPLSRSTSSTKPTRSPMPPSMPCSRRWKSRRPHRLHDGHHAARRHSADHPLALPALQFSRRAFSTTSSRNCAASPSRKTSQRRRRRARPARRSRRRLHARRALHHGPGHCLLWH